MKTEQEAIEKFKKDFTYSFTETDFLRHYDTREYIQGLIEVFISQVWQAAQQEAELDFVRRIEQIDKLADSYDEYTTRVMQYAAELKSKYSLSAEQEKE